MTSPDPALRAAMSDATARTYDDSEAKAVELGAALLRSKFALQQAERRGIARALEWIRENGHEYVWEETMLDDCARALLGKEAGSDGE